jgi:hypothetical protein
MNISLNFLIGLIFILLILPLSGQKISLGLGAKTYWIEQGKYLKNDVFSYEKYSTTIPLQLTAKVTVSKYGHLFIGYNTRTEKIRSFSSSGISQPFVLNGTPGTIIIKKNGLMWDRRLYFSEFSAGIGKVFSFGRFYGKFETGSIYSQSIAGRNDARYFEIPGVYEFKERAGKYMDAMLLGGIAYKLSKKLHASMNFEYRRSIWKKEYFTYDLKYIYNFPSNVGAPLFGIGLGLEYTLLD